MTTSVATVGSQDLSRTRGHAPDAASSAVAPEGESRKNLQLVARVALVLRALEEPRAGLSLSQLSERISLPKSTTHRLVAALEREGFVTSANGRVRLGVLLARLGAASRGALRDEVLPFMRRLSDDLNETVDLSVLDGSSARFIEQIAAPRRLRAVSAVGEVFPLHCTANGKALLATLPRTDAAKLLPGRLRAYTSSTITTRRQLWRELDRVASRGVAVDREEHTEGICAVGSVIRDPYGAIAALTVPLPRQRFLGQEDSLEAHVLETANEATRALGG